MARVPSYVDDVERQFGSFRGHPAVTRARKLRETHGIAFDACMSMAVHLTDANTLEERISLDPRPPSLDSRWTPQDARAFLRELRKFAAESRFPEFLAAHRELYQRAENRMKLLLDEEGHLEWFPEFFGDRPGGRFTVALGLLNGPCNYGPRCRLPDGTEELYCILGTWAKDAKGEPTFGGGVLQTVVHEFCHSYTNAIIDRHEAELKSAGEALYAPVASAMERQAYGGWKTMMYESLVRACTLRYIRRHQGPMAAWWKSQEEQGRQFRWVGDLSKFLDEYESHRDRYPTLESFAPRIVAFFEERAKQPPQRTGGDATGAPRAISVTPSDGARDVDPGLTQIRVVFDQAMKDGSWSLVGDALELPKVAGKPSYDATKTVWTVPIRLEPESSYRFQLNAERNQKRTGNANSPLGLVRVTVPPVGGAAEATRAWITGSWPLDRNACPRFFCSLSLLLWSRATSGLPASEAVTASPRTANLAARSSRIVLNECAAPETGSWGHQGSTSKSRGELEAALGWDPVEIIRPT